MAIVFDAKSSVDTSGNAATSFSNSTNMTVGSAANMVLVVAFCVSGTDPGALAITWNGVAMTQLAEVNQGDSTSTIVLFGLLNPAPGTQTLAGSWTNARDFCVAAVSFSGVNTTSIGAAFPTTATNTGNSSTASVTVASTSGDRVISAFAQGGANRLTFGSVTGVQIFIDATGNIAGGESWIAGSASITQTAAVAGSVAIDVAGTFVLGASGSSSPQTYTGLTTSGSLANGAVTFIVIYDNFVTGSAVTWDGVACTLIASQNNTSGTNGRVELWGLSPIGAHTGNKTLSVSWTGGGTAQLGIAGQSWTGVNQVGGTTTFNQSGGTTSSVTTDAFVTLSSQTGDALIAGLAAPNAAVNTISGTTLFNSSAGNLAAWAGNRDVGATTVKMEMLLGGTVGGFAMAALNILQAGASWSAIGVDLSPAIPVGGTLFMQRVQFKRKSYDRIRKNRPPRQPWNEYAISRKGRLLRGRHLHLLPLPAGRHHQSRSNT